jgi:outer membrane protein assembly factor BamA
MLRIKALVVVFSAGLCAQEASLPLESVTVEGTTLSKETILELTGFHVGRPVDKQAIEAGCKKLEESGLFQDISYRSAPGPKRGYAVTVSLADQGKLSDAAIDIPGSPLKQRLDYRPKQAANGTSLGRCIERESL